MLCNEQAKKQKNTAQMRHSCTLSGRKQPQEPFAITAQLQALQMTQTTQMTQTSFLSLCPLFG